MISCDITVSRLFFVCPITEYFKNNRMEQGNRAEDQRKIAKNREIEKSRCIETKWVLGSCKQRNKSLRCGVLDRLQVT